ncbi:MAG: acyl-CoA thioester hydrolase [Myxococcota bacterium]
MKSMETDGIGPILGYTDCRFRKPVKYPDFVTIGARVRDLEVDRFIMEYEVISRELADVVARGTGRIVTFDYKTQQKAPIPDAVRAAIEALEATT